MNLGKYYRNSTLYPAFIVMLLIIVYSILETRDYKSEWVTSEMVIDMSIVVSLIYCSISSALCLTIFLIKFKIVRNSDLLTMLSWFLLPFSFILTILVYEINFRLMYNEKFGADFIYILLLSIP